MVRSRGQPPASLPFSLPLCRAVVTDSDVFIQRICAAAAAAAAATSGELSLVERFCSWPVARLLDPRHYDGVQKVKVTQQR